MFHFRTSTYNQPPHNLTHNFSSGESEPTSHQVRAVIEHHPNPENTENNNENIEEECLGTINEISDVIVECLDLLRSERANLERDVANMNNESNENEENEHNESNTEERREENR